ncbi:MAG: WYL domain-containing protein [Cytophagaceae bacterium]|nr:WYL domain-containing protein [Cytophagaceae bacterium]
MARNDEARIKRIFDLIRQLKYSRGMTAKRIRDMYEISLNSVYRDIQFIRDDLGFPVKNNNNHYCLDEESKDSRFTQDEVNLLRALLSTEKRNVLAKSIQHKIKTSLSEYPNANDLAEKQLALHVMRLQEAINEQNPVVLKRYFSSNPEAGKTDRKVWPLALVEDAGQLVAYEEQSKKQKNYKLTRIGEVEVLPSEKSIPKEIAHETDAFGLTGESIYLVELNLTKRAYLLLKEEFPRTLSNLSERKNKEFPYRFRGEVRDFKGLRRYIMGLPGEMELVGPDELKEYVKKCINDFRFVI